MRRRISLFAKVSTILVLVAVGVFFIWANNVYHADQNMVATARQLKEFQITYAKNWLQIQKVGATPSVGFVFYPGAKVEPDAYLQLLEMLASQTEISIFVTRPPLNLAMFGINDATKIFEQNGQITKWYVGGHSMGGSMACMFAKNEEAKISGLILLGTYCGSDISKANIRVLSVNGTRDGVFPPAKIQASAKELPSSATFEKIEGMNHAQFGNYGSQNGDFDPEIDDGVAKSRVVSVIRTFLSTSR